MDTTLTANEETILNAKPDVPFGVEGYKKVLGEKHAKFKEAEGDLARVKQEKRRQTKAANDALGDYYKAASELADAMVGHLGRDHKLAKIIRNQRDSMVLEAARGNRTPSNE